MRRAVLAAGCALALTAGASGCSLRTLGAPHGDMVLSATFDDVQSLVTGHSVQISDIRVGTVTGIRLSGFRARVTMALESDRRVPTGTTATIAKSSLLGENYVRLDPPRGRALGTGPFLARGASIGQTSVQPDLEGISEKLGPLLAALSGQDLSTITGATATAVDGKGRQLNTLIKRAADVTDAYSAASADLARALDGLARLGDSLEKGHGRIDKLPGSIALATGRLQNERTELKRAVQQLLKLARSVNTTVHGRHAARLATLLARADTLLTAAVRGGQDLKAVAGSVLTFLRGPSVSSGGQALLFLWIKGFLPSAPASSASSASSGAAPLPLDKLLGPRS